MWLGNIELPQDLVEAHHKGDLVLFVGAGASIASPSDLPSFKELTRLICAECTLPRNYPDGYPLDRILGELDDLDEVDVHARTAAHIDVPTSRPNALHHAIARLAATMREPRIVTTNYDRHLTTSLSEAGVAFTEYRAPALPVGDDFTGLVYLHGSVTQEPKRLIVTDADFGRAYLSDAWAARFLERMFSRHNVLFVGYSHDDLIMTYLARGLGKVMERYAMTDDGSRHAWRQLRIHPVVYSVVDDSHAELDQVLDRWAEVSGMGLLDHRQQVRDLVENQSPSGIPEQESYLSETISDAQRVKFFTTVARGSQWLEWATRQEAFQNALQYPDADEGPGYALALWFAEHYVLDKEYSTEALKVVLEVSGGRIGCQLWTAIGACMHAADMTSESWISPWLSLMCRDDPSGGSNWLDYQLNRSDWLSSPDTVLMLLDHLTSPVIRLNRPFLGVSRPEVRLRGDKYWLKHAWEERVRPNLDTAVNGVLAVVEHNLSLAMNLLVAAGGLRRQWGYIGRIAIEPHDQNWNHEDLDFLIDATRDCIEAMAASSSPYLAPTLQRWAAMEHAVFVRLALHGWRVRTDATPKQKFDWLITSGLFIDDRARHEAYVLASDVIPQVDEASVDAVVEQVLGRPAEDETGEYAKFNALAWLRRFRPDSDILARAVDEVRSGHEWSEREHPDLVVSHSSSWGLAGPVISAEQFHGELTTDAVVAIERLRDRVSSMGSLGREGMGATISSVIEQYPEDGLLVIEKVQDPEVVRAVIGGWSRRDLEPEMARRVIFRLGFVDIMQHYRDICDLLAGRVEGDQFNWRSIAGARELAAAVWRVIPEDAEGGVIGGDVLTQALNHPAGKIADLWSLCVADDWRSAGEDWVGLSDEHENLLNLMTLSAGLRGTMARAMLVTRLHMFSGADSEWCVRYLLPRLAWESVPDGRWVWEAYLHGGRWTPRLLSQGLFDAYFESLGHLHELGETEQRLLCEHFASVAVHGEGKFAASYWVDRFILGTSPGARVLWADQITTELHRLPSEAVEGVWRAWLHSYWKRRVQGVPFLLSAPEATSMVGWIVELTKSVEEGIELGIAARAGLGEHSFLLHELDRDRLSRSPVQFAFLIRSLLENTHAPSWALHDLGRVIADLRSLGAPDDEIKRILEEGARFGFYED